VPVALDLAGPRFRGRGLSGEEGGSVNGDDWGVTSVGDGVVPTSGLCMVSGRPPVC
jgi:hypothetical protein